ncbi:sigma 54-interacting transcriptional regulator [Motiliproteus sp. MSK22-1]|uniref:sigma 54-interacting transcriptional regulator n=1 Tax=Motiliproteus sp. MSK22-1 TaxID=1897630 RepID=UPI0009771BBA|nr:sigma 54-interacting transcriptional regulator [Motiliproteus sp. MSK22-1]OMH25647.1 hypothetical protein BGP75_24185 [Motiliproteus sp. MSK22-1]
MTNIAIRTFPMRNEDLRRDSSLRKLVETISPLPVDLVIQGETGCGKDTLAKTIHRLSKRKGSFIAVNCAAVPETLAESELFGVSVGAYTGAHTSRAGYIEVANEGTLYLDEIDSMPLSLQAKLLRVVETRSVERLGSTDSRQLDVRIIISTKDPLEKLVKAGRFREDLHFRFSTVTINLLALRLRREVIIHMFSEFVSAAAKRLNVRRPICSTEIYQKLLSHHWPGNIRELKAAADRYVLGVCPLGHTIKPRVHGRSLRHNLHEIERLLIEESLHRNKGCIERTTSELDVPKRTLYHRMKQLGVTPRKVTG